MVQWIAILVVLVCLSDLSLSRSWLGLGFDDDDDYESGITDPEDESDWKLSRFHRGDDPWESDEDDEDSEYGNYQPSISHHGVHNDHELDHHGQYHHHHEHQHHGNNGCNHDGHGRNDDKKNFGTPYVLGDPGHNVIPSLNWIPPLHGPAGLTSTNEDNGYGHPTQTGYLGSHFGSHGPSHNGYAGHNPGAHGHTSHTGSHGHPGKTGSPVQPASSSGSPSRGLPQNNPSQPGSTNDGDRVVFPDFKNQTTTTTRVPSASSAQPAVTAPAPTASTTDRSLLDLVTCIRSCPVTAEYNPVCGSNNVTYNNPGVLECAKNCGLNVTIARRAPCSRPVPRLTSTMSPINSAPSVATTNPAPATTTTEAPIATPTVKPTRFTSVDVISKPDTTLIPSDILQSIFGSAPSSTEEPEFDIDQRKINRS